jgi:hypothetical protein
LGRRERRETKKIKRKGEGGRKKSRKTEREGG